MTADKVLQFHEALRALRPEERDLLTIVALAEPLNITHLATLASAAGIRETASRQHSTKSLRVLTNALLERQLVYTNGALFACRPEMRYQALRHAAAHRRLVPLANALSHALFGARPASYDYSTRAHRAAFDATLAIASAAPHAERLLDELAALSSRPEVAQAFVVPALLDPFDGVWFEHLPSSLRASWLPLALAQCEAFGHEFSGLCAYLLARKDRLLSEPGLVITLGGIALAQGNFESVRALATLPLPEVSASLNAALLGIEGRYAEACELIVAPRKGTPQGSGLLGILHVLLLLTRAQAADLAYATRLINTGSRKGMAFRSSYRLLKQLADRALVPAGALGGVSLFDEMDEPDSALPLVRMLYLGWFESADSALIHIAARGDALAKPLLERGLTWLATETKYLAGVLRAKASRVSMPSFDALAPADWRGRIKPLLQMRSDKASWELALEGLERLALASNSPTPVSRELDERLVWRVDPWQRSVEPFLQKRVGSGFSKGRKLAVKHIMPGGAQHAALPPEDAKVARFAREEREIYAGYPQVRHYLLPQAFTALIGHPRVFVGEEELPLEVLRGQVQLVVRADGETLSISLDPPDFMGALQIKREGQRLFVYAIEAEAEPLLKWVGRGLRLPVGAQARALEVLGRLSHLLPVQSFEQGSARSVAADPKPWLRIAPRAAGLSVTLSTRPLGETGPQVPPGKGAPTQLGRVNGETVQAERDLETERQLAATLIERCSVLVGHEAHEFGYVLSEPSQCLELISTLRELESEVHVEWPQGNPLRLRARASRKALRGAVKRASDFFLATGSLEIDSELSIELEELLTLLTDQPGRFIRLASGDYVELEQELRDALDGLNAAQSDVRGTGKSKTKGVALAKSALSALEELTATPGFTLDAETKAFRQRLVSAFERKFPIPRRLEAELRGYQEEGFRWLARLAELELGACLADDMGLGKTIQVLALLLHRMKLGPQLVVAPSSVCDNWRDEIARFAPALKVRWFLGSGRDTELEDLGAGHVLITSYALLQQDAAKLQARPFATAVLDEAQFIKNADSLRARAAAGLDAGMRIALTGTPVENHVGDLFGIFQFLMPDLLGSRTAFARRFPLEAEGEVGSAARRKLRRLIQPFVLRRTKAQVLQELPELTEVRRTVTLTPAEATLYETLRRSALAKLSVNADGLVDNPTKRPDQAAARANFQVLAEITRLRRLCCHPELVAPGATQESSKLASFLELVEELIEGRHRALVFSQFVDMLSLVRSALDQRNISYQYLDGSTPLPQRKAAVEAFQAGDGDLFLISLRAGGFGLNLTGADYVVHLDPWWNPAVEAQASDRAHRIGQTRPVTVYRLITAHTIEERILDLHRTKRELADSLLEESDRSAKLSAAELRALLDG